MDVFTHENVYDEISKKIGTDKLIAAHRAKIAKLKEEKERRPQSQKKGDTLWNVKKEGAGQVLFIGFPNSGKSSLVSNLTGEELEIADYPFTTRNLLMRMMRFEDIMIQLVDTTAIGDENTHLWFGNMIKKADLEVPFILHKGSTVKNAAERIHKDFVSKLRYAKLWREGSLSGMMVSKDFVLEDRDIIELHL